MKITKSIWIPALIILLIISSFIFYYEVIPRYNQNVLSYGYEKALQDLYIQGYDCKKIPIEYNNLTLNFIPIECLQEEK